VARKMLSDDEIRKICPRNRPNACNSYGREKYFKLTCFLQRSIFFRFSYFWAKLNHMKFFKFLKRRNFYNHVCIFSYKGTGSILKKISRKKVVFF